MGLEQPRLNKRSSSEFQQISPEEGQSVQQSKHQECDSKDEDISLNNIVKNYGSLL